MNEHSADVKSWSEASGLLLAPLLRIQQDGLGALNRFVRCQFAVAGDFLEWSLALSKVTLVAQSPATLLRQQTELGIKLRDQLQSRVRELTQMSAKEQSTPSAEVAVADSAAALRNVPAVGSAVSSPVPVTAPAAPAALSLVANRIPPAPVESSPARSVAPTARVAPPTSVRSPVSKRVESAPKERAVAPKPKSRNKP